MKTQQRMILGLLEDRANDPKLRPSLRKFNRKQAGAYKLRISECSRLTVEESRTPAAFITFYEKDT